MFFMELHMDDPEKSCVREFFCMPAPDSLQKKIHSSESRTQTADDQTAFLKRDLPQYDVITFP